jgi:hypothetical protein
LVAHRGISEFEIVQRHRFALSFDLTFLDCIAAFNRLHQNIIALIELPNHCAPTQSIWGYNPAIGDDPSGSLPGRNWVFIKSGPVQPELDRVWSCSMNRFPGSLALILRSASSGLKFATAARNAAFCTLACVTAHAAPAQAQTATTTTLTITSGGSAAITVPMGTVVTLTATVVAGPTPVSPGQVNFCDATAAHCEDIHIVGTAQLTSAGTATFKFRPGVGSHSYNAVFLGAPNGKAPTAGSTSANVAITVTAPAQYPSTTAITVTGGTGAYQLSASVSGIGPAPPTGSVSFLDASNGNAEISVGSLGSPSSSFGLANVSNPSGGNAVIAVADFNQDGIPDLAAVTISNTAQGNSLIVQLGKGDGTFTTVSSPTTASPLFAVAGDFNGDGIPDLALANGDGTVTIQLGNGDGTFTAGTTIPALGGIAWDIAAGDFNRDGNQDLAVVSGSNPSNESTFLITILLGNGNGAFTAGSPIPLGGGPPAIAVGDFDSNGILDIVAVYELLPPPDCGIDDDCLESGATTLTGNGDGTFNVTNATGSFGQDPTSIVAADFTGTGSPGFAYITNGNVVNVPSAGGFTATLPAVPAAENAMAVGDFNGDGIPDLAIIYGSGVMVLLGTGNGSFTSLNYQFPILANTNDFRDALALGDFNGDGLEDIAVPDLIQSYTSILLSQTQFATTPQTAYAPGGVGTDLIEATYPGDPNYTASLSTAALNRSPGAPTVTVTPSVNPAVWDINEILTVAVAGSGPTPTGTVTLYDGGAPVQSVGGSGILTNGVVTFSGNEYLVPGAHSIVASYSGDNNYPATNSSPLNLTAVVSTPTITWPTPSPISYGTALSATQLDATAQIQYDQSTEPATGTIAYSPAAGRVLNVGSNAVTATFTPSDPRFFATVRDTVTVTVTQVTPGIALASSANPVATSTPVTFTANLSVGNGTATGTVSFYDGSTLLGSSAVSANAASFTTSTLASGSHSITAVYSGDSNCLPVTSAALTETVTQGQQTTPTITWAAPAPITYGTALSATQLNATASVAGTFAYTPAAGTVLSAGTQTLSVTFTPTNTTAYSSVTATVTLTVSKATPTFVWTPPPSLSYGTALTATQLDATSTIAGTFTYSPPIGTVLGVGKQTLSVTFTPTDSTDYTTATATAAITVLAATPAITWATPSPITYGTALTAAQLNATSTVAGTFAYTPAAGTVLSPGAQALSVTFTPTDSTDYTTATSTVTLTVNKATPTIALVSSAASAYVLNSVTFTATLSSPAGSPTGTVSFYDGTTLLGSATVASGSAAYSTSALLAGTHSITAVYSGDSNFAGVTSGTLSQVIENFTIATQGTGTTTVTASPGGQAVYTFTVAPPSGTTFAGPITFSVTGLPAGATATFSPATVLAGAGTTTVTMTVTLSSSAAATPAEKPFGGGAIPIALGLVLLPFGFGLRRKFRGWGTTASLLIIGMALAAGLTACGGSGGSSTPPPQTYSLTISATSGSLSNTIAVDLTVQ